MTARTCCVGSVTAADPIRKTWTVPLGPRAFSRLSGSPLKIFQWSIPATIVALLPKCPACIVAYVLIASGIGISVTTAAYLRAGLLGTCLALFAYRIIKTGSRSLPKQYSR